MDKLYIIGVRYNPQLGSYLSKVKVAKVKVNKTCISAKFEDCGYTTSVKFYLHAGQDGMHFQKGENSCVYGSYTYYGFEDKDKAIAYLKATWLECPRGSSAGQAKVGIELIKAA